MEEAVTNWKAGLQFDFENLGLTYTELSDKYGRSRSTIINLIKKNKWVQKVPSRTNGVPFNTEKPISPMHSSIGHKINHHRTLELQQTPTVYADGLRTNRVQLRRMELGIHDFTLQQLNRISQKLGIPLKDLMTHHPKYTANPDD
jgi:hypothetical protein